MNKFTKNNYLVIKNVISKELTDYLYNYLLLKRQVADSFFQTNYISKHEHIHGTWNDAQVPNTYTLYCDSAMEVLLTKLKPIMEKHTALKLVETYSFSRIYKKGDILYRHTDRDSCEISTTLNLGGNPWPIFLDPTGSQSVVDFKFTKKGEEVTLKKNPNKGKKIILTPGDMLVYKGCLLEHWRDAFKGDNCGQVFLHYNDLNSKNVKPSKFDGKIHLGLPKDHHAFLVTKEKEK